MAQNASPKPNERIKNAVQESRLPEGVHYPNVYTPSVGVQLISLVVLVGAAGMGYLGDFFFMLVLKSDGLRPALSSLVSVLPIFCIVVYVQEFAFNIRKGKVPFFRNQSPAQLLTNALFIFSISAFLVLITQRIVLSNGRVEPSWESFLALMTASYACNGIIAYFRKHPFKD